MMKTAKSIMTEKRYLRNSAIDVANGNKPEYSVKYEDAVTGAESYADQYKQESEVLKKEIAKAKMIVGGLMQDNQRLRELSQELLEDLKKLCDSLIGKLNL